MFHIHAERLRQRIATIRSAVVSADKVRALLAEPAFDPLSLPEGDGRQAGHWLRTHAPQTVAWKEFDHNAATTALYAAYESSVYDLLREWIMQFMPSRWPKFTDDLPENVRTAYIHGLAAILPKLQKGRYSSLKVDEVARCFAAATSGSQPYQLHPETFFSDDQNLRSGRLNELLNSVGLEDAWGWISRHPLLIDYIDNVIGGTNSLDSELGRFVQARNDAAHGQSGNYLGISELEQLADLAERIGIAVIEMARKAKIDHYRSMNLIEEIGEVSEILGKAKAIIVKASGKAITLGQSYALLSSNCCDFQTLLSCQENGVEHEALTPTPNAEIGLRFGRNPRLGATVLRVLSS